MFFIFTLNLITVAMFPSVESQNPDIASLKFNQNGYTIVHDRIEMDSFNKEWINHTNIFCYWFNRTARVINFTITVIKDFSNAKIQVQAYKFMSNEYRYFPLGFEFKLSTAFEHDIFGFNEMIKCGNFPPNFFFKKGHTYEFCNWLLDSTKFPPYIPFGKYKLHMMLKAGPTTVSSYSWYGALVENIKWN